MLTGIAASAGVAIGRAAVLRPASFALPRDHSGDPEAELAALTAAMEAVTARLKALSEQTALRAPAEAEIFDAHITLLWDECLLLEPAGAMIRGGQSAAGAVDGQLRAVAAEFAAMDDPYMRERSADLDDLRVQLLRALLGEGPEGLSLTGPSVVVARELTPSDTAGLDLSLVRGFVTELGGPTAHSAVMARALGLPAVVGAAGALDAVSNGDMVVVDGDRGTVLVEPPPDVLAGYGARMDARRQERAACAVFRDRPSVTADGHAVQLAVNIGAPEDAARADAEGADGVGLFRTEFFYMGRETLPTEDEQYAAYAQVLRQMGGRPVVVRTLDVGGDKRIPAIDLPPEDNPFLGLRALRLCLKRPELFRTQLRALLRASVHGNLHIMFPMVSSLGELRAAKAALSQAREELAAQGVPMAEHIPVGIMVEIPAAALLADAFAAECDFFSIGTNDLTQYTLAADRGNSQVAGLYQPCHPAVLALVKRTADAARARGIWCGMCGEAAGTPALLPLWLGLGLTELSMSAPALLPARRDLSRLDLPRCRALAGQCLALSTAEEVQSLLARGI